MSPNVPATGLHLTSRIGGDGTLRLALDPVEIPAPGPDEIVVRVEASPINPSDLGLLLGPADPLKLTAAGKAGAPIIAGTVPETALPVLAARLDKAMPVGNEGAGTVVAAGSNGSRLLGRRVTAFGGGMYAQYRVLKGADVIELPDDVSVREGASAFINPLTVLAMLETMTRENHSAIVHTAAASNLGQMLTKLCLERDVPLVNIVRSEAQETILRDLGATQVLNSTRPDFTAALVDAIAETGATLAFDAIGGGPLAGQILEAMERALSRGATQFNRYGTTTLKQAYIYGVLDPGPTIIGRTQGFAWSVGGWLMPTRLAAFGAETTAAMRREIAGRLKTTFASDYTAEISLREALDLDTLRAYARRATGEKYLIDPSRAV
ncbi:zinc-binding dehydrogenase [Acuticoccus kandeliae]|uniref:zinc-binding dehydrogenase n=1 Tax=Acuticoccus kandeliae TaxID=2073160 RepID=UPI000D3E577E|nr:zinc-binding dehydrogenase [Acuticoccus kandeliae]